MTIGSGRGWSRRFSIAAAALAVVLVALPLAGCTSQQDKDEDDYIESTIKVVEEANVLLSGWDASPGDSSVAVAMVELKTKTEQITPPKGWEDIHKLLVLSLDSYSKAFDLYAIKAYEESNDMLDVARRAYLQWKSAVEQTHND